MDSPLTRFMCYAGHFRYRLQLLNLPIDSRLWATLTKDNFPSTTAYRRWEKLNDDDGIDHTSCDPKIYGEIMMLNLKTALSYDSLSGDRCKRAFLALLGLESYATCSSLLQEPNIYTVITAAIGGDESFVEEVKTNIINHSRDWSTGAILKWTCQLHYHSYFTLGDEVHNRRLISLPSSEMESVIENVLRPLDFWFSTSLPRRKYENYIAANGYDCVKSMSYTAKKSLLMQMLSSASEEEEFEQLVEIHRICPDFELTSDFRHLFCSTSNYETFRNFRDAGSFVEAIRLYAALRGVDLNKYYQFNGDELRSVRNLVTKILDEGKKQAIPAITPKEDVDITAALALASRINNEQPNHPPAQVTTHSW